MSEEQEAQLKPLEELVEESKVEEPKAEVKEESPEDKARSQGWRPKSEYKGPEGDWVPADEFLRRGDIFNHIKDIKKELRAVVNENSKLRNKISDAEMRGYQQAIQELEEQKQYASNDGDDYKAQALDEKINAYKQTYQQLQQSNVDPEISEYYRKNSDWLGKDQRLTQLALYQDNVIRMENPDFNNAEVLAELDKRMAKHLGREVKEEIKTEPAKMPPIAPAKRASSEVDAEDRKYSIHDLNPAAKDVFKGIQRIKRDMGENYTVNDYLAQTENCGQNIRDYLRGDD